MQRVECKLKIEYVCERYNWDSFGIVKSNYEALQDLGHDVNLHLLPWEFKEGMEQLWIMTSKLSISDQYRDIMREKGIKSVMFGLSDPNLFDPNRIKNCDVYCTSDLKLYERLKKSIVNILYFPVSCDSKYHECMVCDRDLDLVFMGTGKHPFVPDRIQNVNKLRWFGYKVSVFGNAWPKHEDNKKRIHGDNMLRIMRRTKLCLDLTNSNTSLSRRIFENSCCGIPVLTHDREDIRKLFNPDKEILLYTDFDDMVSKIKYWGNNPKLVEIGMNARIRCLKDHDVKIRIANLLTELK